MTRSLLAWCLGITIVVTGLVVLIRAPLASVEDQFTVLKYHVRGAQPADTNIVIVYIDNEAIRTLGWPVRRNFYALMINTLSALQAKAVGVEIQFEDPRLGYPEYPEYDNLLASVIASSKNVVLASYFDAVGAEPDTTALNAPVPSQFNFPLVNGSLPEGKGLHLPLPRFMEGAAGVGHVNFIGAGVDVPVLVHRGSGVVPAFAAEVLRLYCGAERSGLSYGGEVVRLQSGNREIQFPTSDDAAVQLNLPNSFGSYRQYPFLEVLRAYDALRMDKPASLPALALKGKLVLVGVVAEGRSEFRPTPIDPRFPSIGLHAAFIDNALHSKFLRTTSAWLEYLLCFVVGFGGALSILLLPSPLNKILAFGALALVILASFILFSMAAVQLPLTSILTVGFVTSMNALFLKQRQMRAHVHALQAERETILAQLKDREAKVALLERELLEREAAQKNDARAEELFEEIRRYKAEIFSLSSRAGDLEEYPAEEALTPGEQFEGIVYDRNGKMRPVVEFIKKIAGSDAPVLILGESGTGKELVARAIWKQSPLAAGPFVAVNCGALSENLLESELFGHEKGAFTGAVKDKPGRFELADQGTIFLDEIGEVSEGFQLKLLRVLQEGEFERVGGTRTIKVKVRLLAATNKDLMKEVNLGKFREDLYYRVNVLTLPLPPLRERRSDIPVLVDHFLKREGEGIRVSRNVMEILQNHPWRGNVRELESTVRRAVLLCKADKRTIIAARDLGDEVTGGIRNAIPVQDQVLDLLREKGFSRSSVSETAEELGGLNRGTVAEYLRGECLKAFDEQRFDIEATVRHVSLSADSGVNDRVRKKLCEYLTNIVDAVDVSQPWESSKAALKPKAKNLPQRYHGYLEQVAEAYYRGLWKLEV